MKIMVVCEEGFSPKYTGGGEYINGIYKYIPRFNYLKIPKISFTTIKRMVEYDIKIVKGEKK